MDLAIQIIDNDETVRSDAVQDLKEFNNQSLATPAKKVNNYLTRCLLLKSF